MIIELSQLIGEKPPTVQMPRPAERRPSLLKPEDIERRKAQREIEEHEGLTDILVRRDGERSPKTIQDMVDACLRGLIEPDDVLIPDTPSERRQYRVALSLAADMPADVRVGNWKERFRELQVLGNPALAEVLDT